METEFAQVYVGEEQTHEPVASDRAAITSALTQPRSSATTLFMSAIGISAALVVVTDFIRHGALLTGGPAPEGDVYLVRSIAEVERLLHDQQYAWDLSCGQPPST